MKRRRERRDHYELVDKEAINVLEGSRSDRDGGHGGAAEERKHEAWDIFP